MAAESIRQAWQEMPEIAELSKNLIIEETDEGLNIQLIDQDGRAMFPSGSKNPYTHTKLILEKIAPIIKKLPNQIKITGHSDSTKLYRTDNYTLWELTADRANSARHILAGAGIPDTQFSAIVGKADSEPLFPEDTFLAANRRISILIMHDNPPFPPEHKL